MRVHERLCMFWVIMSDWVTDWLIRVVWSGVKWVIKFNCLEWVEWVSNWSGMSEVSGVEWSEWLDGQMDGWIGVGEWQIGLIDWLSECQIYLRKQKVSLHFLLCLYTERSKLLIRTSPFHKINTTPAFGSWPGNARSYSISSHIIDLVCQNVWGPFY